jgi:hypothetical protein
MNKYFIIILTNLLKINNTVSTQGDKKRRRWLKTLKKHRRKQRRMSVLGLSKKAARELAESGALGPYAKQSERRVLANSGAMPIPVKLELPTERSTKKQNRNAKRKEKRERTKQREKVEKEMEEAWRQLPPTEQKRILEIQNHLNIIFKLVLAGKVSAIYLETRPEGETLNDIDLDSIPPIVEVEDVSLETDGKVEVHPSPKNEEHDPDCPCIQDKQSSSEEECDCARCIKDEEEAQKATLVIEELRARERDYVAAQKVLNEHFATAQEGQIDLTARREEFIDRVTDELIKVHSDAFKQSDGSKVEKEEKNKEEDLIFPLED